MATKAQTAYYKRGKSNKKNKAQMKIEFKKFNAEITRVLTGVAKEKLPAVMKRIVFDAINGFIAMTPVDTGRARAGWYAYLDHSGLPPAGGGPGAAQGRAEGSFEENVTSKIIDIQIINRVPYIMPLEYGHSKQAPGGMVRVTLRRIRKLLQKIPSEVF